MKASLFRWTICLVLSLAIVGSASSAHATPVTYATVGTFTGGDLPGTRTYLDAANGIEIKFEGVVLTVADASPTTAGFLGQFNTTGTTAASLVDVLSDFVVEVFQFGPTAGSVTFSGTLTGSVGAAASNAFVQFSSPSTAWIGDEAFYTIVAAGNGVQGRVNLAPPGVDGGVSPVSVEIGAEPIAVPEPATLTLTGLGLAVARCLGRRRQHARST